MTYLGGTAAHQLDTKNRIRIPANYRAALGKEYFFLAGSQGCIFVYSKEALEEKLKEFDNINNGDKKKMLAKRKIQSAIFPVEEDTQGRVTVSQFLRNHAGITRDLITVGMGTHLEIWAKERYVSDVDDQMSLDDAYEALGF